jgi:hypothetical protein
MIKNEGTAKTFILILKKTKLFYILINLYVINSVFMKAS